MIKDSRRKETVVEVGIGPEGKYEIVEKDSGDREKVIYIKEEDMGDTFFMDKYNKIHNYRREEDQLVFYYNLETKDKIILAVVIGDDLSKEPFNLKDSFIVKEETIGYVNYTKGLVALTNSNLEALKDMEIINEEEQHALKFNRKNAGFYF